MNRDELLTNLAMGLKRFPDFKAGEAPDAGAPGLWNTKHEEWECFAKGDHTPICKNDWLERRVDLINEPDDADAPEGYKWKAQDGDGEWCWYSCEPKIDIDLCQWVLFPRNGGVHSAAEGSIPAGHDWKTTLREVERETRRQLNPSTSNLTDAQAREAAEETQMRSDGYPCDETPCSDCPNQPDNFEAEFDAKMLDQQLKEAMDATNPKHYRKGDVECIDALKAATIGKTGIEAVCVANVIKYLWRYEEKNGVEDVEKALWYLNRLHDELHD